MTTATTTTPKQLAVLDAIVDLTAERGYPPTMREIAAVRSEEHMSELQSPLN